MRERHGACGARGDVRQARAAGRCWRRPATPNLESIDAEGLAVRERHGACGARGGMRQARAAEQEVAAGQRNRVAARAAAQPASHSLLQHPGVPGAQAQSVPGEYRHRRQAPLLTCSVAAPRSITVGLQYLCP